MKKYKLISVLMVLLLTVSGSILAASAKTVYDLYGYSYTIINNTSLSLCGWDNSSTQLSVPDTIMGRYFTEIEDFAFQGNTEITLLDFSQASRLNMIGFYAFKDCTSISYDLVIPETVTNIREGAFKNCSSVKNVTVKAALTTLNQEVFCDCSSLETAVLPNGLSRIDVLAFGNCTALIRVDIPKSVTSIADSAFRNDKNLTLGVWYESYAYQYARNKSIPYVLLDDVELGDTDGDGHVSINDVTLIQRHLAELESLEGIYLYAADANCDGDLDISDATAIQMFIAKYKVPYPIGELITQ